MKEYTFRTPDGDLISTRSVHSANALADLKHLFPKLNFDPVPRDSTGKPLVALTIENQGLWDNCRPVLREHFEKGPQQYPDSPWLLLYVPPEYNGYGPPESREPGYWISNNGGIHPPHNVLVAWLDNPATVRVVETHRKSENPAEIS